MPKRVSMREEARRRGVSHGTIFSERKKQSIIGRIDEVFPNHLTNRIGKDFPVVYAWRWSNDDTCAKIGVSEQVSKLKSRMVTTYHPTDDPVLIGFMPCSSLNNAKDDEDYFLYTLERTRPDREWVVIDKAFNEIINEAFISDPSVLRKIFGKDIKTEKSYNENS